MNLYRLLVPALLLTSSQAFAYYCSTPAGNGFINTGDTMAQVQQACGTATSTSESNQSQDTTTAVQYWTYENAEITQGTGLGTVGNQNSVQRSGPSTTVEIANGKITNIMQDSSQGGSSGDCISQANIQVGDSSDKLMSQCGSPTSTTTQPKTTKGPSKKVTTWTYDRGQYSSPLVLTFEEGSLTQIQD